MPLVSGFRKLDSGENGGYPSGPVLEDSTAN
jgi:hypothetical protein